MPWLSWAGPPGLLCVDAGTGLNAEEIGNFLQRHSVKCRTCAAEAHWQNARTERHGGILQLMFSKMDHENPIQNYEQLIVHCPQSCHQHEESMEQIQGLSTGSFSVW